MKKFGKKFYSGKGVIFNPTPKNKEESIQYGNALAFGKNSNYPVGTSDCFNIGISGGCGINCFVINENRCDIAEELYEQIELGKRDEKINMFIEGENEKLNKYISERIKKIEKK